MSTETKGMDTKEGKEVSQQTNGVKMPEELSEQKQDLGANLEAAGNDIITQMRRCDEQVEAWLHRKQQLQSKMSETLQRIQREFGGDPAPAKRGPGRPKENNSSSSTTTAELIRKFLLDHGPSRTTDIRKFLLDHGKKTSPGVALSRMVRDKAIVNVERGIYKLP